MSFKRGNAVLRAAVAEFLESRRLLSSAGTDPDDQMVESQLLEPGNVAFRDIDDALDVDMYKFEAEAGREYEIRTNGSFDNFLRLFKIDGTQLASDDDSGDGASALIRFTFAESGSYFAGVSGFGNFEYDAVSGDGDQSGATGSYSISVGVNPVDDDDQIVEAVELPVAQPVDGFISDGRDVDMFKFQASAGADILLQVDGDFFDHHLRLFNADGDELEIRTGGFTSIRYVFSDAGAYYVGVSGYGNDQYNAVTGTGDRFGENGFYTITLFDVTADPDDQISEAVPLSAGNTVNAEIDAPVDVDMYSVGLVEGEEIRFDFFGNGGNFFEGIIRVFNADGDELYRSQVFSGEFQYTATFEGVHYVGISGDPNLFYNPITGGDDEFGATSPYSLTIVSDDFDDQFEESRSLGTGFIETGAIGLPKDVDAYGLSTFGPGVRFGVDVDRAEGSSLDSYLRVFRYDFFSETFTLVAANDNAAAPGESAANGESYVEFTVLDEGSYYAFVSGNPNRNYNPETGGGDANGSQGEYSIELLVIPDTDDQATAEEAIPTPLGSTISGKKIDYDIDVDMYRFIVAAGTTMEFDLDLPSGSALNSYLRLFQSDEFRTQIAANDNAPASGESVTTKESYLKYYFPTAGEYFISVSGFPNASFSPLSGEGDVRGATGPYTLITKVLSVVTPPTGDSDDQISEARSISTSSPRTNQSIGSKDVDMYKFTVSAGQRIGFDVDRTDGNLDSYLRVFRSNGTQLAANDDGRAPGETASVSAYLEYTFSSGGTYYVAVSGDPNRSYSPIGGGGDVSGSTGGYSLYLTNRTPAAARGVSPLVSPFRKGRAIDEIELS